MMSESRFWFERRSLAWVALVAMLGCAAFMQGQNATVAGAASQELASPSFAVPEPSNRGLAGDWSHRHLIFSHLGTAEEALRNGTYDRWLKITGEPRYVMQQLRRREAGTAMQDETQQRRAGTRSGCGDWRRGRRARV